MKISQLVKKLNQMKKEHGDIEVMIDMKATKDEWENEQFSFETAGLKLVKFPVCTDPDTLKVSKRKYKHAVLLPESAM